MHTCILYSIFIAIVNGLSIYKKDYKITTVWYVTRSAPQACGIEGQKHAEMLDRMQTASHYAGDIHTAAGGFCSASSQCILQ
jgi:hypothetical protein